MGSIREQLVAQFAVKEAALAEEREQAIREAEREEREAAAKAAEPKALPSAGLAANIVAEAMIDDKDAAVPFTGKNGRDRIATVRDEKPRAELNGSYADLQELLEDVFPSGQEAFLRAVSKQIKRNSGYRVNYETLVAVGFNKVRGLLMSVEAGKHPTRATWNACKGALRRAMKAMKGTA